MHVIHMVNLRIVFDLFSVIFVHLEENQVLAIISMGANFRGRHAQLERL